MIREMVVTKGFLTRIFDLPPECDVVGVRQNPADKESVVFVLRDISENGEHIRRCKPLYATVQGAAGATVAVFKDWQEG